MEIDEIKSIIEREAFDYIQEEKGKRAEFCWTSSDFKLINRFKHRLLDKFEKLKQEVEK